MPFIKIMGKNDNKKKVKKANVKAFPVDSALEQEKKNLNSKRTAYAIYTVFCFVIVFAAAAAAVISSPCPVGPAVPARPVLS